MTAKGTDLHRFGPWEIAGDLADGARIGRLRYAGVDLLTAAPADFRPPAGNYGRYETRPVYGYDDCFPTVDACGPWPDHGELCWLPWTGSVADGAVASQLAPLRFTRRLEFEPDRLRWHFRVRNDGTSPYPVQHVMHPLMPPEAIEAIELPAGEAYDPAAVAAELAALPAGSARMLFLQNVSEGAVRLGFRGGPRLTMRFPLDLFPTLGIWWNRRGYPAEPGRQRSECAFEPVPGGDSTLAHGTTLTVPAGGELSWYIDWEIACP
jgi:hypothetical protein